MGFLKDLLEISEKYPEQVAIRLGKKTITYSELSKQLRSVALNISYHLPSETRISFACRPSVESITLALGLMYAGNTLVMNTPYVPSHIFRHQMKETGTAALIADPYLYRAARTRKITGKRIADLKVDDVVNAVFSYSRNGWKNWLDYSSISSRYSHESDPHTPAIIMYPSSKNLNSHAVVHTRNTLSVNTAHLSEQLGIKPGTVVVSKFMTVGVLALAKGATWVVPDSQNIPDTDVWFVTPTEASRSLDTGTMKHVKHVVLSSSTATPSLICELGKKFGPRTKISCVYATKEMFPISVGDAKRKNDYLLEGDYVGQLIGDTQSQIVNGELWLKGSGVASYLGESNQEWFKTGDLASVTADREIILKGRKNEVLVRHQQKILPAVYEPAVTLVPGVREAALVQDPQGTVVLAVTASPGYNLNAIVNKVEGLTSRWFTSETEPDHVVGFDRFPVKGTGLHWDKETIAITAAQKIRK